MFNQTLRNICSFFAPGKKSIFIANNQDSVQTLTGNEADKTSIRLLYHRDIDTIETTSSKQDAMQHDWWIN